MYIFRRRGPRPGRKRRSMPEYQELPSNKERLSTLMLPSLSPSSSPSNASSPNSEVSSLEKKAEVNLPASGHRECEQQGTSGKQSLRSRMSHFRSFHNFILSSLQANMFSNDFSFSEVGFHGEAARLWPLTGQV